MTPRSSARHHVVGPLLRHEEQRKETGPLQRAKLRAQSQRIVIFEIRIDDDKLEGIACRLEQGRLRLRDGIHLCHRLQRPNDALLRAGAAIRNQNPARRLHQPIAAQHLFDANLTGRFSAHAQFVANGLQAHQAFDAGDQLQVIDRLGQEIIGSSLQTPARGPRADPAP